MSTEIDKYLSHMGLEVGDDLKHFGVKGMKWGVRKNSNSSSRSEKREKKKQLRALDKESAKKDLAKEHASIDAARKRVLSGKTEADYKKAKAQYKVDKETIGKREAWKTLEEASKKRLSDYETAQRLKNGKELFDVFVRGTDWYGIPFTAAEDLAKN